jgi:hypothetical protein
MPTNAAKSSTGDALDRLEQLRLLGLGQLPEPTPGPDDGFIRWAAELQEQAQVVADRMLAELEAHPFDVDADRLMAEMAEMAESYASIVPAPDIDRLLTDAAAMPFVLPELPHRKTN